MRITTYLMCLAFVFGCSKSTQDETSFTTPDIKGDVSINLANAFAYATNLDGLELKSSTSNLTVTNSDDIESNMIAYLCDLYGSDLEHFYYESKNDLTPDLSNYESLPDISLDELNENNTQEFVEKIFAATRTNLKSTYSYKSFSTAMQSNVDDLIYEIEDCVQSFMVESIEYGLFDEINLKNSLLSKIQEYRESINWQELSTEEHDKLLTTISTVENSIGNFISFSLTYPTEDAEQFALNQKSTQNWLKNLVKTAAKITVMTVCLVGGSIGGAALGFTVCGGNAYCGIAGGVAGFTVGAFATSYISDWIDSR